MTKIENINTFEKQKGKLDEEGSVGDRRQEGKITQELLVFF